MKKPMIGFLLILSLFCLTNEEFQFSLFKEVSNKERSNVVISPLSIHQALSIVANGAKGGTQKEMTEVLSAQNVIDLNLKNQKLLEVLSEEKDLHIANAIMSRFTPSVQFINSASRYGALASQLQSAEQVNKWCANKTNNKITNIIDNVDDVEMLILNAVYLNTNWKYKFQKEDTHPGVFHNYNKKNPTVKMMYIIKKFMYFEDRDVQIVSIPYTGEKLSALVFLPKKDINDFTSQLTNEKVKNYIFQMEEHRVKLTLPKFELEFSTSVKKNLIALGMKKLFNPAEADLSNISEHHKLYVDEVLHKTYLKVDEVGTEAAAVTVAVAKLTSFMPTRVREVEMIVDRPFLFMINHYALDEMLFIAKVDNLEK